MKRLARALALSAALMMSVITFVQADDEPLRLQGTAEDLWGNPIDLGSYDHGITLIEPFSPST